MSEHRTKRLINAPADFVSEAIEGMASAHPHVLRIAGATRRAVVAVNGPRDGKVGIVIGGGSGHEPAFAGYVGRGLADAAAVGNVFASPSPEQIMDAVRAVDGGAGVMLLYGNYTGDVMNFDMAAEECASLGIPVRSIAVNDDVASAPTEGMDERRGIAGDFFVFKAAGAAAELGHDIDACERAARHALANTRSMGVALTPCSMPQTGKANFEIGPDEMEIGMGLHGEPGMRRGPLESADSVVDQLLDTILADMPLSQRDEVALLVNGLGATGLLELYVLHRRLAARLSEIGVVIHHSWVGEYATSLEMAGASVTILRLDDTLKELLETPCHAPALTVGVLPAPSTGKHRSRHANEAPRASVRQVDCAQLARDGDVTPADFRSMMRAVAASIRSKRDWLSQLDGVVGDGDHGITMDIGWTAAIRALDESPEDETISLTCERIATAFLDAVGASSGPLYASGFREAGKAVGDRLNLDAVAMVRWIEAITEGIRNRGKANIGDKTMVDAWIPAAQSARQALQHGADLAGCLDAACSGARMGLDHSAEIESRRGRSAKLGKRSIGHMDPGAASAWLIVTAIRDTIVQGV